MIMAMIFIQLYLMEKMGAGDGQKKLCKKHLMRKKLNLQIMENMKLTRRFSSQKKEIKLKSIKVSCNSL
jgi:hypothetical protein